MAKIKLTENKFRNMIREAVKSILHESYLNTNDIDTSDLRVNAHWTEDGYAEWEAKVDNGWYSFRGTYDGYDCELDEIIVGHSGHGHQVDVNDEAIEWFDKNLRNKVMSLVEKNANSYEEWHNETYGVNESRLRRIIQETVSGTINELDITSKPRFQDARERDAWWKEQALNDFPESKYKINQTISGFQDLYYELRDEKERKEKALAKKERQNARAARQQQKQQRELEKQKNRSLFLNTVKYVIGGDDSLMSDEQIMNDINNEVPDDWYDGVSKIPVVVKAPASDGTISIMNTWANIDSVGSGNGNGNGFINFGWGGNINSLGDNGGFFMKFTVYVDPKRKEIQFAIDECDNENVITSKTEPLVTKYLNGVVRRKYKEVAAKIEKYGTADITGW